MTRLQIKRTSYLIAALATLVGAGGGILGFVGLIGQIGGGGQQFRTLATIPMAMGGGFVLLLAGVFLYLARKPRGWGKLLCVIGLPWIGFSTILGLLSSQGAFAYSPLLLLPAIGGATLLAVGIVLLVQDGGRLLSSPAE
jgi:hypothetical protein